MARHLAQQSGNIWLPPKPTSGCYVYAVDGIEQARETFVVTPLEGGGEHVHCVRDASAFGVHLMLDAACVTQDDRRYMLTLRAKADGPILSKCIYSLVNQEILFHSTDDKETRQKLSCGVHLFPLMRYFTSEMVMSILENGGQQDIIVPDIAAPTKIASVFAPLQTVRTVTIVLGEPNVFDLSGGAYDAPARLYLGEHGLLSHYAFTDSVGKVWTCRLEDI
jgi:hypothetical protein